MNILFAVPAYKCIMDANTSLSISDARDELRAEGIESKFCFYDSADVAASRNVLCSRFLHAKQYTHIFMSDADMAFSAATAVKMAKADVEVIACAATTRFLDIAKVHALAKSETLQTAIAKSSHFNIYIDQKQTLELTDGRCKVQGVGLAVSLIARPILDRLLATKKVPTKRYGGVSEQFAGGSVYGFFDPLPDMPEDISFCRKVITWCGRDVWALASDEIIHIGLYPFKARYADLFKSSPQPARTEPR